LHNGNLKVHPVFAAEIAAPVEPVPVRYLYKFND
jgi:hypothetical protein